MTTHGDILVRDADGGGMEYWLHAYSDGHRSEAREDLIALPQWLAARAILYHWQSEQRMHGDKQAEAWGSLGPFQADLYASLHKGKTPLSVDDFHNSWISNLGADLVYCNAQAVATYMIQRRFNRWFPIREQDAPWHDVGKPADIVVTCSADDGCYTLQTNGKGKKRRIEFAKELEAAMFAACTEILEEKANG